MAEYGTRSLVLRINGTDYSGSVNKARIVSAATDSDFVSFPEAAAGGARKYTLNMNAKQDDAASALWFFAWSQPGQTVPYELWPNGRPGTGVASPAQPRFSGNVVVMEPDGDFIGGDADVSPTKYFQTELEWHCTAKPVRAIS
jgi:hypothetical protein